MSNYKIAVLGDKDSVLGFKALVKGAAVGADADRLLMEGGR